MNNKVNKNLFYVLPVIAILVVVAIGLVFVQPKYNEINQLNAQKSDEIAKQEKMQQKLKKLSELDANKTDLQAQLASLTIALPNQKEIPGLIIAIQKIAEASDVQIQAIQITPGVLLNDPAAINKAAPELPLVLNARGNYEAIKTFLGRVYKAKRLINMTSLALNTSSVAGEDGQISASINLISYYQPLPPVPQDATEELPNTAEGKTTYDKLEGYTAYTIESGSSPNQTPRPSASPSSSPEASGSATTE